MRPPSLEMESLDSPFGKDWARQTHHPETQHRARRDRHPRGGCRSGVPAIGSNEGFAQELSQQHVGIALTALPSDIVFGAHAIYDLGE